MKKKRTTYFILIPIVAIIWGTIVYKINTNSNDYTVHEAQPLPPKQETKGFEYNGFKLKIDYPDPFFRTINPKLKTNKEKTIQKNEELKPVWPNIVFNGYVINGKVMKGHFTINGQDKILQVNDFILDKYRLAGITADSAIISFRNMSKWYKK